MHQPPRTIKNALDRIASSDYVLPAIQREFVWSAEQMCALFDSLMQGYPIGEFLFWRIDAENSAQYRYYGFMLDYHQRDNPHCPDLGVMANKPLIAVLDGQQRLTALNIGLRGSMAVKLPRRRWASPDAFPRRVLALDLLAQTQRDENGNCYKFDFIDQSEIGRQDTHLWFQVSEILAMEAGPDMLEWIVGNGIDQKQQTLAYRTLDRLHRVTHTEKTIACYEEGRQDIEHVLNIFIRRNSGGTVLAYSDLLLSIAVSQWDNRDARSEVHALVDDLNGFGSGLGLSKDFVLKAGLMLANIASVGFEVRNFTHTNMATLERCWSKIRGALVETVQLVTNFGFDSNSIRAHSALLPIAYYIYEIGAPPNFDSSAQYKDDRNAIKEWLIRSVLKASGIWGSGLDTLLTALREVLRTTDKGHFPATELYAVMAQRGKSLDFGPEEIEDLADMRISDRRVFAQLTLLFPIIDVRALHFHIDHVFPKSLFTPARLRSAGIEEEHAKTCIDCGNRLGNLQLLEGVVNNEKRAKMPVAWMQEHYLDDKQRQHYRDLHLFGEVPEHITGFMSFYEARRERLRGEIEKLVGRM